MLEWLDQVLRPWFSDRILAVDEEVILSWRKMIEQGRKQGYTFSQPELFIAATAMVHNLCVVTRTIKNFEQSGIPVLNSWELQTEDLGG